MSFIKIWLTYKSVYNDTVLSWNSLLSHHPFVYDDDDDVSLLLSCFRFIRIRDIQGQRRGHGRSKNMGMAKKRL